MIREYSTSILENQMEKHIGSAMETIKLFGGYGFRQYWKMKWKLGACRGSWES